MVDYTHLRVLPQAAESLRELAAIGSGLIKTRITQSQALAAAVKVARERPDDFAAALIGEENQQ